MTVVVKRCMEFTVNSKEKNHIAGPQGSKGMPSLYSPTEKGPNEAKYWLLFVQLKHQLSHDL